MTIQQQLAELEARAAWGREHPYAGVCGEDDALQDQIEALREELQLRAANDAIRTAEQTSTRSTT